MACANASGRKLGAGIRPYSCKTTSFFKLFVGAGGAGGGFASSSAVVPVAVPTGSTCSLRFPVAVGDCSAPPHAASNPTPTSKTPKIFQFINDPPDTSPLSARFLRQNMPRPERSSTASSYARKKIVRSRVGIESACNGFEVKMLRWVIFGVHGGARMRFSGARHKDDDRELFLVRASSIESRSVIEVSCRVCHIVPKG